MGQAKAFEWSILELPNPISSGSAQKRSRWVETTMTEAEEGSLCIRYIPVRGPILDDDGARSHGPTGFSLGL